MVLVAMTDRKSQMHVACMTDRKSNFCPPLVSRFAQNAAFASLGSENTCHADYYLKALCRIGARHIVGNNVYFIYGKSANFERKENILVERKSFKEVHRDLKYSSL